MSWGKTKPCHGIWETGQSSSQHVREPCETLHVFFQETTNFQSFVAWCTFLLFFFPVTVFCFYLQLSNQSCLVSCQSWLCNTTNDNGIDGEARMGFLPSNVDVKHCLERSPWRNTAFILCIQNKIEENWT